jgi:hypothetical protein
MTRVGLAILALAALPLSALPAHAKEAAQKGVITALYENDVFGGTDRNYTNGVKFAYVSPINLHNRLAWQIYDMFWSDRDVVKFRASWGFGQSMFTPDDISVAAPIPGERPYAGWLYGFYGFSAEHKHNPTDSTFTNVEIELGVVGESAHAKWVQREVHQWIDGQEPRGWDNQLKDEPGIALSAERAWRRSFALAGKTAFDIAPSLGLSLGNVRTEAFAGVTARIGTDLEDTALPMRVRPSLAGSGSFDTVSGWAWSAFAGVYGQAVARNIFLDGNTFHDSLSVDKKPFLADMQAGFAVRYRAVQVSYTYAVRGEEYYGQLGNSRFGAICLSVHL